MRLDDFLDNVPAYQAETEIEKAFLFMEKLEQEYKQIPASDQWRVYHAQSGDILAVHNGPPFPELEQDYITVTKEQALDVSALCRVVDKKLVKIDLGPVFVVKLTESEHGRYRALGTDMSILLEPDEQHESIKRYDHSRHSRS